jgi:hypothetical protein
MKLDKVTEIYLPCLIVPMFFLLYAVCRYIKHWHDGMEPFVLAYSRTHYTKRALVLTMLVLSLYHAIEPMPDIPYTGYIVRKICYFAYAIAWGVSYSLLIFEHNRRLKMAWLGHRSFWPMCFVANMLKTVVQSMMVYMTGDKAIHAEIVRGSTYAISTLICFILTIFALFRPVDFSQPRSPLDKMIEMRRYIPLLRSYEASPRKKPIIKVRISDMKVKQFGSKNVPLYTLSITILKHTYTVRRSYLEFQSLHTCLRNKFDYHRFPCLNFPALPKFSQSDTLDFRMNSLTSYLSDLCYPEFMSEELLDFLEIDDSIKEDLLTEHNRILDIHAVSFETTPRKVYQDIHIKEFSFVEESNTQEWHLQRYIYIRIQDWKQVDNPDTHIEYRITWQTWDRSYRGSMYKRYNEIYALHCSLKKTLSPATLPEFPSKFYLDSFRKNINTKAIECRQKELEAYLGHILNDPAYHCEELFQFIGFEIKPEALWTLASGNASYDLTHIIWESEVSDIGEHYVTYVMEIERTGDAYALWTCKHRYREFWQLHKALKSRAKSPALLRYIEYLQKLSKLRSVVLPKLPRRNLAGTHRYADLQNRRNSLESYCRSLMSNETVTCSYEFRKFMNEPDC